jgi:hypothetical protein
MLSSGVSRSPWHLASSFDRGGRAENPSGVLVPVPPDPRTAGLTYEPFYWLREKPFSLTSDSRFFYQSRSHAPAFDDLLNAIRRRESLNVLTGDIGTGKTTLSDSGRRRCRVRRRGRGSACQRRSRFRRRRPKICSSSPRMNTDEHGIPVII